MSVRRNHAVLPPGLTAACCRRHVAELQANFVPRETDCFVTTYPKCGTTWMQQICVLLKQGREDEDVPFDATERVHYNTKAPWLDMLYPDWTLEKFAEMDDPRIFKTHAPFELMPTQRDDEGLPTHGSMIYVARNPKDACVSHFHHARAIHAFNYDGTWGDFIRRFLGGDVSHPCARHAFSKRFC